MAKMELITHDEILDQFIGQKRLPNVTSMNRIFILFYFLHYRQGVPGNGHQGQPGTWIVREVYLVVTALRKNSQTALFNNDVAKELVPLFDKAPDVRIYSIA